MEKTKNGVVCAQNRGTEISLQVVNFASIAKFRYVAKFQYIAKISLF